MGDGSADDTAAVQNAYNAAVAAGGGVVVLPKGFRFKIPGGFDLTSSRVSLHSYGGWLTVGQIRVGDPTGTNDFTGVELRNVLYDGEDAYGSSAKALVLKGNCRGLKVVGGAFKNTGKCVSADDAEGATGFHKLGKITFDGTQFQTCNYNIYVNTVAWDVCSDWRLTGLLGGDTTRIKNIYISGVDGIQIDTCVFFMADSASGYAHLTDKLHNVHIGETSQLHVHGNQFFVAGSSALRVDECWTLSITGNGFIWPGQITQGDCIELRGASSAGNLVGTITGNTFNNWTRNAIGIYADTTTDASKLVIADSNAYSQNLSMTTNLTGVTLTPANCYRVYIHSSVAGFPRVAHIPSDVPVYDWWKTSDRPQGRNLRGTFYGGEATCIRRAVTINSATPVGIFTLSGGDSGNVYSGLIVLTAHSSAISTAKEASYLLHVSRDGTRDPVVALISEIGLTTGAAADEPSFTWTLGSDNILTAARVGSTVSGTNWWFRMDSYGTVVGR